MKLSNLLRWAGTKEASEAPADDSKGSGSSFWGMGRNGKHQEAVRPEAAPTPLIDGLARVDWTEAGGPKHQSLVEFSGGVARLRAMPGPAPYGGVWVTPQGGRPVAAKLIDRQEEGDGVRLEASLDCPETDLGGAGGVRLSSIGEDGAVTVQHVRIAASEKPGAVHVTSTASVDNGVLVFLEAREYGCLGLVRESRPDGDSFTLEVETVMQAQELRTAA